jgi:lipoprotein-anchoring transpeptidase ErfK/SrfK
VKAIFIRSVHPSRRQWQRFLVLAFVASGSIPLMDDAIARSRHRGGFDEPRHHVDHQNSRHRGAPDKKQKPEEAAAPSGPMFFVVSLGRQHVSVYSNDGLYARAPISTGMPGHPTPMGIFNILGKERLHHSNIYSGAPMPFMQRITWSGVAMHEGALPGYPASHGCIRLPHEFARRMYGVTQGNERVVITRQDVAPAPFSHPKLPVPALLPEPGPDNMNTISAHILQNALATSDGAAEKVFIKADGSEAQPGGAPQKLLNPLEYAKAMKVLAAKKVEEAAAAAIPARTVIQAKAKEMQTATVDLRKAQIALSNAKDRLEAADRQIKKASGDAAVNAANAAKTEAEAKVKEAEAQLNTVQRAKAQKDDEWATALKAYKDLDNIQRSAAEGVKIWSRRLAPVSVFISRKTQRLYVRQNFLKVFDVPVTIRDPQKPLGTHLYMAMPPAKGGADGPRLRWLVLTLPEASADTDRPRKRHSRYYDDDDDSPRVPAPATSASTALDRIEMSPEVAGKISEMLWTGGSLIVSDSGISSETDDYSDFVILTR